MLNLVPASSDTPICPLCQQKKSLPLVRVNHRSYWHCHECHLIFLLPEQRLTADTERERYLQHKNDPDDPRYRRFLSRLSKHLTPYLAEGAYGLDYGAGPGPTLSIMLEEQGFPMDIYDPFFAPEPAVLQKTYDFITCTEAIEHFFNPAREFARLNSMLKPGGWLGIMTGIVASVQKFEEWWYHRDPTHVCFYQLETMRWIARKFGWMVTFPSRNVTLFQKTQA